MRETKFIYSPFNFISYAKTISTFALSSAICGWDGGAGT